MENVNEIIDGLSDENKSTKKRSLETLLRLVEQDECFMKALDGDDGGGDGDGEELLRALLRCVTDRSERCRELSCGVLLHLLTRSPDKTRIRKLELATKFCDSFHNIRVGPIPNLCWGLL